MEDMVVVGSLLAALPVAGLNFGISCFKIVLIPKLKLGRLGGCLGGQIIFSFSFSFLEK